MRRLLPFLLFLFTLQSNAKEFDLPLKISWETEKGIVSREINSQNIIEVSNALSEDRKNISFKLEVTSVILDETSSQIAFIGYWSEESPDDLQINHQIRVEAHLVA